MIRFAALGIGNPATLVVFYRLADCGLVDVTFNVTSCGVEKFKSSVSFFDLRIMTIFA